MGLQKRESKEIMDLYRRMGRKIMGFWVMLFCFVVGIVLLVNSFKYRKNKTARFGIELVVGFIFLAISVYMALPK
jgi:Ca2+/Na+ antiporter